MKKVIAIVLSLSLLVALAACGSSAPTPAPAPGGTAAAPAPAPAPSGGGEAPTGGDGEITILNNKVEIDGALKEYAAIYEQQTGIKVNIQSFGGDTPYEPALVALIQGGEEPDIFVFEGPTGYEKWSDRYIDLSDQPWVNDTDVAYRHTDGKVYGFPVAIEGYGLAYNKSILDRAGVDPAALTNFAALQAAFEKIDSQKAELGLDAVVSFSCSTDMWWTVALHNINVYLTGGLAYDDTSVADDFMNGVLRDERFNHYANYVGFLAQYSDKAVLATASYDDQIALFTNEKAAFLHQGNWAEPNLYGAGITFSMGYVPHAFLPTEIDGIHAAAPSWYGVNDKGDPDLAKDFLNAMVTTPEGQNYMVKGAGAIPAFKSITLEPDGDLSKSVMDFAGRGKIYSWQQYRFPDGFALDRLGPVYQLFGTGQIDLDGFKAQFISVVNRING